MKSKIAVNPYLPLDTYIPDGEPHVFEDRIYIYGSHDKEGGTKFCMLPYECWSAPVDDLSNWRCEGSIYYAEQDKDYSEENRYMFAPDVVKGADGRYYLYYAMSGKGCFTGPIHVAVCDTPAGKYEYYGEVRTQDGNTLNQYITFDPAVFADSDGTFWLYYGWSLERAGITEPIDREQLIQAEMMLFNKTREEILGGLHSYMGANVVKLSEDMLTIEGEINRIVPGQFEAFGTEFEGHAFFEASSMRKINDTYYFIYSSQWQHELCYATSKYPDKDFSYGGVIISNGDIGYEGRKPDDRVCITGNNHGSIENINGQWYVFYHRQTHKTTFSRQGCAEPIRILVDGSIPQVQMSSCGLNGGALPGNRSYPAVICCELTNGAMPHQTTERRTETLPHITNEGEERFLAEITDGTTIGYRWFQFMGSTVIEVTYRGNAEGILRVELMNKDDKTCADTREGMIIIRSANKWTKSGCRVVMKGDCTLRLHFEGKGELQIKELELEGDSSSGWAYSAGGDIGLFMKEGV